MSASPTRSAERSPTDHLIGLVLFHSAFIALKAQDESDGRPSLDSHILDDERAVFSA